MTTDPKKILVDVSGVWGDTQCTLADWVRTGPGGRVLKAPSEAYDSGTGAALGLKAIPRPFRNDIISIWLILDGLEIDPWGRDEVYLRLATVEERQDPRWQAAYDEARRELIASSGTPEGKAMKHLADNCWMIINDLSRDRTPPN